MLLRIHLGYIGTRGEDEVHIYIALIRKRKDERRVGGVEGAGRIIL
jgi:hypothetical protein